MIGKALIRDLRHHFECFRFKDIGFKSSDTKSCFQNIDIFVYKFKFVDFSEVTLSQ